MHLLLVKQNHSSSMTSTVELSLTWQQIEATHQAVLAFCRPSSTSLTFWERDLTFWSETTELQAGDRSLASCSRPVQLVLLLKVPGGRALADWKRWIIHLLPLRITFLCLVFCQAAFLCDHGDATHSLSCCHISMSPVLMLSLHHNFWPTNDPERQLLFKTYAQQQQQTAWWGGVEWRDGEVEIHSAHNFFSPAVLMYYAWLCCAYFKGLLDMVYCIYTRTRWYFQLAVNCTIWSRWVCVSVRIIHHLPNVVGGSLQQEAKEKEWAREVVEAYRRAVKEVKRKAKLFYMWDTRRQERASPGHRHTYCTHISNKNTRLWTY